jgi:hypothetical protein
MDGNEVVTMIFNLFTMMVSLVTLILWVITLFAGLATLTIYYRQLRVMEANIRAQDLAWLVQYLQSEDVRHARSVVMVELSPKPFAAWGPKEQEEAATACAAYGVAGVYMQLNRVDKNMIIQNWGPSIEAVCGICDELIVERRNRLGQNYWSALVWLREEVKKA